MHGEHPALFPGLGLLAFEEGLELGHHAEEEFVEAEFGAHVLETGGGGRTKGWRVGGKGEGEEEEQR